MSNPRINWNAVDREEDEILSDPSLSNKEKNKAVNDLYRELRDEYRERRIRRGE